jgi:hypothetical protein
VKTLIGLVVVAAGITIAPAVGGAQERLVDGALGALSGAVVAGPVGAIAGGVVGYTAGPNIACGLGLKACGHRYNQHSYRHEAAEPAAPYVSTYEQPIERPVHVEPMAPREVVPSADQ